jgi:non-heme chloroperoxidase
MTLALFLVTASSHSSAASARSIPGKDYIFPNKIDGLLAKLSEFKDLEVNSFQTNDGAKLLFWLPGFLASQCPNRSTVNCEF